MGILDQMPLDLAYVRPFLGTRLDKYYAVPKRTRDLVFCIKEKYKTYDIGVRDVSIIVWSVDRYQGTSVGLGSGEGASSFLIAVEPAKVRYVY